MTQPSTYRPPQYAAAIVNAVFPTVEALCDSVCIPVDVFNAARRRAEEFGSDMIVLGVGQDSDGQIGDLRVVATVHPAGAATLGLAPIAAHGDTYLDACERLFLIRLERVELMMLDVMVGTVRADAAVTLH